MKAVDHQEKLTRTELRAKQEENLRLAAKVMRAIAQGDGCPNAILCRG